MNKQEYADKLRNRAHSFEPKNQLQKIMNDTIVRVIEDIADELEQMDVAWVPREPTQKMIEAGAECHMLAPDIYRRMLNAAEKING